MNEQQEKDFRKEFQEFADGIMWSNDDGSEKYIAVGSMCDWLLDKVKFYTTKALAEKERGVVKEIELFKCKEYQAHDFKGYVAISHEDKRFANAVMDSVLALITNKQERE
jgi:hypothetical protein